MKFIKVKVEKYSNHMINYCKRRICQDFSPLKWKKIENNTCFKEDDLMKKWLGDIFLRISKDITIFFSDLWLWRKFKQKWRLFYSNAIKLCRLNCTKKPQNAIFSLFILKKVWSCSFKFSAHKMKLYSLCSGLFFNIKSPIKLSFCSPCMMALCLICISQSLG